MPVRQNLDLIKPRFLSPSFFCQGDEQSYLRNAIVIRRREKAWVIRIAFCELDSVIGINGAGRDRPHPRTLGTQ